MSWRVLGTVSPDFQWQSMPEDLLGGPHLLRFQHTWTHRPAGYALLRQQFYDGDWGYRRLYPASETQRLIQVNIPTELRDRGIVVWRPAIRLGGYTRRYEHDGWAITVEVLEG